MDTPSLDKAIPNRQRTKFKDEVADAVNRADSSVKSKMEDIVVDDEQQNHWSDIFESHELPSADSNK